MEGGLVEERVVPRDKSNASTFKEIRERLINKEEVLKEIDKEVCTLDLSLTSLNLPRIFLKNALDTIVFA